MTEPLPANVRAFVEAQPVGILATTRPDGSIRQSLVYHVLDGDRIEISTLGSRAKARDVARIGRASYCVPAHERPFASVTLEGPARIVTEGAGAITTALFGKIFGTPPDPPLTDEAVAAMDRVILELTVARAYGASYLPED
ncbi:MAG: hypothetical protein FJW88_03160 [Actinobacteria bacterium]|nr:hypothetical protein [Actinomycetota bacterium]